MCNDKNIKEMLPAYLDRTLSEEGQLRVEEHLKSCEDCSFEIALLRTMIADGVPDPGEAFWNGMPGRVYRAVQQEKTKARRLDLSWFVGRITLPRWVLTAATAGVALIIAWFAVQFPQKPLPTFLSEGYEVADDIIAAAPIQISELDQDQLDSITLWAGKEFASIGQELEPVIAADAETDIYDELAGLTPGETEQLAVMLEQWKEEEQS